MTRKPPRLPMPARYQRILQHSLLAEMTSPACGFSIINACNSGSSVSPKRSRLARVKLGNSTNLASMVYCLEGCLRPYSQLCSAQQLGKLRLTQPRFFSHCDHRRKHHHAFTAHHCKKQHLYRAWHRALSELSH